MFEMTPRALMLRDGHRRARVGDCLLARATAKHFSEEP